MNDDAKPPVTDARFTAAIATRQVSAKLACASFLANCEPAPPFGSPEHRGMIDGKDSIVAMAVASIAAEFRHGTLKHLSAEDARAFGAIMITVDQALSRRLGIDTSGNPLQ